MFIVFDHLISLYYNELEQFLQILQNFAVSKDAKVNIKHYV